MANRVHFDPARPVWGGWKDGRPWTYRAIERELRAIERDMGWTITPGHNARALGHEPPERGTTGSRRRLSFGAEITVKMGPSLQNARSWRELQAVLQTRGMHAEARPKGMVITDGKRYIGACRIRGLKGGRPDLEDRFGQTLEDFLETGESLEPPPSTDWVWKVRLDSLYHARRHFNKTPELYALYKESLAWKAARRAEAAVKEAERSLEWHRRALRKAERAQAEAAHTQLGVEGALAVMRQRPERLGLPPPSRAQRIRQRVAGERAKDSPLVTQLAPEVRAYARAKARVSAGRDVAEGRRAAQEREKTLRDARDVLERATPARRSPLSKAQHVALRAFERSREPAREVADRGL